MSIQLDRTPFIRKHQHKSTKRQQILARTFLAGFWAPALAKNAFAQESRLSTVEGATNFIENVDGSLTFTGAFDHVFTLPSDTWVLDGKALLVTEAGLTAITGTVLGLSASWLVGLGGGFAFLGGAEDKDSADDTPSAEPDYTLPKTYSTPDAKVVETDDLGTPLGKATGSVIANDLFETAPASFSVYRGNIVSSSLALFSNVSDTSNSWVDVLGDVGTFRLDTTSGLYEYSANSGDGGTDTFTYRVFDADGNEIASSTISFTVKKASENNHPGGKILANDTSTIALSTNEDIILTGSLVAEVNQLIITLGGDGILDLSGATLDGNPNTDAGTSIRDADGDLLAFSETFDGNGNPSTSGQTQGVLITYTSSQGGVVVLNTKTGEFSYTPPVNYFGSDSFVFAVSDGAKTISKTIDLTVNPVNDAPMAANTTVTILAEHDSWYSPIVNHHTFINLAPLVSDVDPTDTADTMTYEILSVVGGGVAYLRGGAGSSLFYYPDGSFAHLAEGETAVATIEYSIADSDGSQSIGEIEVVVTGRNYTPRFHDMAFGYNEGETSVFDLSKYLWDPDSDDDGTTVKYTFDSVSDSFNTVSIDKTLMSLDYTDDSLALGETKVSTIMLYAEDRHGLKGYEEAKIIIHGTNDSPVIGDIKTDYFSSQLNNGGFLTGRLSAHDVDATDMHTFSILTDPVDENGTSMGTITVDANGVYRFTPNKNLQFANDEAQKEVSFTYLAQDDSGADNATATTPATATMRIVNDANVKHFGSVQFAGDKEGIGNTLHTIDAGLPEFGVDWDHSIDWNLHSETSVGSGSFIDLTYGGLSLTGHSRGEIKLKPYIEMHDGELNIDVPVNVSVTSDFANLSGNTIKFSTAYSYGNNAEFSTKSPALKFGMRLKGGIDTELNLEADPSYGKFEAHVDMPWPFDDIDFVRKFNLSGGTKNNLLDLDTTFNTTLFEHGYGISEDPAFLSIADLAASSKLGLFFEDINFDPLYVETQNTIVNGDSKVSSQGAVDFLGITNFDVDQFMTYAAANLAFPGLGDALSKAGISIAGLEKHIPNISVPDFPLNLPGWLNDAGIGDISLKGVKLIDGVLRANFFDYNLSWYNSMLQKTDVNLGDVILTVQFEDGGIVDNIVAGSNFEYTPDKSFDLNTKGNADGKLDFDVFVDLDATFQTTYSLGTRMNDQFSALELNAEITSDLFSDQKSSFGPHYENDTEFFNEVFEFYKTSSQDVTGFNNSLLAFSGHIEIV